VAGSNTEKAPVAFLTPRLTPSGVLAVGDAFKFAIRVVCRQALSEDLIIGIRVRMLSETSSIFGTSFSRQKMTVPRTGEFEMSADLHAHLIPGRYVIDAYAVDPNNLNEVWASAGLPVHVAGDDSRFGRAHLGGKLDVFVTDSALAPGAGRD